ncbi:MAG: hypothetical protein RSE62_03165 [Citrobacter sp.]
MSKAIKVGYAQPGRPFKLGQTLGDGWHVTHAEEPKKIVLVVAWAYNFLPPPVIETLFNPKHQSFDMRLVGWSRH